MGCRSHRRLQCRLVRWSAFAAFAAIVGGCAIPPGDGSDASPTPDPTPPNTVAALCETASASLERLGDRLAPTVTNDNLVDQGTALAMTTGVLAASLAGLRDAPETSASALAMRWFAELDAAVNVGIRAVRASAAGDVRAFRVARDELEAQRARAATFAEELGYEGCLS